MTLSVSRLYNVDILLSLKQISLTDMKDSATI
jgi:hypothetical protein